MHSQSKATTITSGCPPSLRMRRHKARTPALGLLFRMHYPMTLLACCLPGPLATFLQLVHQQFSISLLYAAQEGLHSLRFVLPEDIFGVPQVVLQRCGGLLRLDEHALDLDVCVRRAGLLLLLLLGMLIDWFPFVFVFCSGLRESSRCYARRY